MGEVVVDLHGAELPFAADDILHHEVDLGAVERGLARLFGKGHAEAGGRIAAGFFRLVPIRGIAGVLGAVGIAQADAHAIVLHAEQGENGLHEIEAAEHFLRELFLHAEEMRVVLREGARTRVMPPSSPDCSQR